jgi:hypothetical protein
LLRVIAVAGRQIAADAFLVRHELLVDRRLSMGQHQAICAHPLLEDVRPTMGSPYEQAPVPTPEVGQDEVPVNDGPWVEEVALEEISNGGEWRPEHGEVQPIILEVDPRRSRGIPPVRSRHEGP